MSANIDRVASVALTVAALIIAVSFAHREFGGVPAAAAATVPPPTYYKNWKSLSGFGRTIGDTAAPVQITEFADFECPYCKAADSVYRRVKQRYGSQVALVFVHFPLSIHRFALPAARASECALEQGRFAEFHDVVYDKQDSLGLTSWTDLARRAGVPDTVRFAQCVRTAQSFPAIQAGISKARSLGLHGTPTVFVNGWQFAAPPTEQQLDSTITALTRKRSVPSPGVS